MSTFLITREDCSAKLELVINISRKNYCIKVEGCLKNTPTRLKSKV